MAQYLTSSPLSTVRFSLQFSIQAVEELNIKPKYWKDLTDDTPFTRKDIIHLQDPLNLEVTHA